MNAHIQLGEVIESVSAKRAGNDELPILSMTMHCGLVDQSSKFKKRVASEDTSQYKIVERDQLVVGFPIDEGVLSFQKNYDRAIVSPAYGIWAVTRDDIEKSYLERFLRSPNALNYYSSRLRSTTARRRSLPQDIFLELPIPLPPLDEQRRIAAILDHAEALHRKRKRALELLDGLTQSIFLRMFDRTEVLPSCRFEELLLRPLRNGVSPSTEGTARGKVLTLSAITGGEFRPSACKDAMFSIVPPDHQRVYKGSFLICRGNGNKNRVGLGVLSTSDMADTAFPDTMIAGDLDEKKIDFDYMEYVWNSTSTRRQIDKGARTTNGTFKINQTILGQITLPIPDLEEQRKFGETRRKIMALKIEQKAETDRLKVLFASLQHRAFSGQL